MRKKAVEDEPETLEYVSDHFKTQEMCIKALEENPWKLRYVHDHLKTHGVCKKAIEREPSMLKYVPDQFKAGSSWRQEKNVFLTIWYAEITNV